MKAIQLTQGQYTIVDDIDYYYLIKFKWYAKLMPCTDSFYAHRKSARIRGKQHSISMARVIMKTSDHCQVDHINHDTLDNRKNNLRNVTSAENHYNQKHQYDNTCGYSFNKKAKKFQAQIGVNNRNIYLGMFKTEREARIAYVNARKIYHIIGGT